MERIEIPAEVYFVARDKRKFLNEAECTRYEYLLDKYTSLDRHRAIQDGEGHEQHFFYISKEEISEICEWSWYLLGYRPWFRDGTYRKWDSFEKGWVWLPWEEQYSDGPTPELGTIDEFIDLQKETVKSYQDTIEAAELLKKFHY